MSHFMFSVSPNDAGEIECIAKDGEKEVKFIITENDIGHMQRYIHIWKLRRLTDGRESEWNATTAISESMDLAALKLESE